MPRVIFGIHALAHLLFKMRLAPPIQVLDLAVKPTIYDFFTLKNIHRTSMGK